MHERPIPMVAAKDWYDGAAMLTMDGIVVVLGHGPDVLIRVRGHVEDDADVRLDVERNEFHAWVSTLSKLFEGDPEIRPRALLKDPDGATLCVTVSSGRVIFDAIDIPRDRAAPAIIASHGQGRAFANRLIASIRRTAPDGRPGGSE